jgi:hypothetical protein
VIAAGAVTLAKMDDLAANSILGNNTGLAATPIALSATDMRTFLNVADGATAFSAANAITAVEGEATLDLTGVVTHMMGAGIGTAKPVGAANVTLASVGNDADAVEKDLITYALPADSLSATGKGIRVRVWGITDATSEAKTIKLYFGATVVIANAVTAAPESKTWEFEALVFRTGVNTQDAIGKGIVDVLPEAATYTSPTETDSGSITIKVTGQGSSTVANEVVAKGMLVEFIN